MTHYLLRADGVISDLADGAGGAAVIFSEGLPVPLIYKTSISIECEHSAALLAVIHGLHYVWSLSKEGDTVSVETRFGTQIAFPPRNPQSREFTTACVKSASDLVQHLAKESVEITFDRYGPDPDEHLVRHATQAIMAAHRKVKARG